jgi:GTPase SAR1 family protein
MSDGQIRYSQVEPKITEMFEQAKNDSLAWEEKFVYCRNRLKVIVQSALLSQAVEKLLEEKFFQPVEVAQNNADTLVSEVFDYFKTIEKKINETEQGDKEAFKKLLDETQAFAKENIQADLKSKYVRGSFRLLNRDISINLKKSLPKEEGTFQIASENTSAHQVQSPSEIVVKKINLHELFEQSILINFLPVIEERIEGVSNYLESLLMEMEQAFSIITYSLESQIGGEDSEVDPDEMTESLQSSISAEKEKIQELYDGLIEYIRSSNESTERLLEECQMEVRQGIERFSVVHTAKNQFRQKIQSTVQKIRDRKEVFDGVITRYYRRLKKLALQKSERDIDRTMKKKLASHTLDTATVREFIKQTYDFNQQIQDLPRLYYRLFSLDPIQDRRFFVAHKKREKHFKNFAGKDSKSESQKILIIGDRGMGKSSMINVAQMDIETERLIRIEGDDYRGPLAVLSRAINAKNSTTSILSTLRKTPATVIIDNADQMLNRHNLSQFEGLFEVISKSPQETHWILSITKFNLESLDRAFKIRSLFSKIIDLHEINLETAKEVILTRHRLSGLEVEFPKTFVSEFAQRAGLSTEDEMFFRVLFERSQGHLRHLIYLWLRSLESSDGKTIHLSMSKSVDRGLPMLHEFSFLQKHILAQLYCSHSASVQKISHTLGVSYSVIDNETQYLEHCHLIQSKGIDRSVFEIPNPLVLPVGVELKKEGILNAGFYNFR